MKYGMGTFDNVKSQMSYWTRYEQMQTKINTADFLNKVILAFAKHGNMVIVGKCGFAILKEFSDVLHVRIKAPLAVKGARIITENITSENKVEDYIKEKDENREKLLQVLYNVDWYNTQLFNMVLDTGKIRPDRAVAWIVEATRKLETESIPKDFSTQSIKVDPLLEKIISEVLA